MMKLESDYQESKGGIRNNHRKENLNLKREHFMEIDIVKAAQPSHQKL